MRGQTYGVGDISRICKVGRGTVNKWMEKKLIEWGFNGHGHKIVSKKNLVSFLKANGMVHALEVLGEFMATVLACTTEAMEEGIDDFLPESIGLYGSRDAFD